MSAPQTEKVAVEIRPHLGRPAVFVDGEPHPLAGYNYHPDHVGLFSEHKMGVYLIGPTSNPDDYRGTRFWVGDLLRNGIPEIFVAEPLRGQSRQPRSYSEY